MRRPIMLWMALIYAVFRFKPSLAEGEATDRGFPLLYQTYGLQKPYVYEETLAKKFATIKDRYYTYKYNPNYGHHPYWGDGEHVLIDPYWEVEESGMSTEEIPQVCGEDCSQTYRSIKEVCVHNTAYNSMDSDGHLMPNYFQTIDSYCEYLAIVCKIHIRHDRITLLHIGKCTYLDHWFVNTLNLQDTPRRLSEYSLFKYVSTPAAVNWPKINKDYA